jgi:LysR family nitrogen assimilation transcriptional regulator
MGMPGSVSPTLVQPLLAAIGRQAPMVTLRVVEAMSGYLLEWLHSGRVDIAVLFTTQPSHGLRQVILPEEPLFLVGHRNAFGPGEKLAFKDIPRYPLVLPGKMHGGSQLIHEAARRANVTLNVQVEVDAVGEMMGLIEQGAGYTPMVPMGFAQRLARGVVSVARIVRPAPVRQLAIATADVRPVTKGMELVQSAAIEILTAGMRQHAGAAVRKPDRRSGAASRTMRP